MTWTALGLALLLAATLGALAWRRRADAGPTADWVVEPLRLLTPAERELFQQLQQAFPRHVVLTQVSLAKLLRMRRSRGSMAVFQRYSRMAAPFVVCTPDSMPLIVVDAVAGRDAGKPSREQHQRAAVLAAAGLVHLVVPVAEGAVPAAQDLRLRVRAALQAKPPRGTAAHVARVGSAVRPTAAQKPAPSAALAPVRRIVRSLLPARAASTARPARAA